MTDDTSGLLCLLVHARDPDRPRRLYDGARLCLGHEKRTTSDLARLASLHDELTAHLVGGGGDGTRRSKSDETGIAVNVKVIKARDHIRATLVSWTRIALEEGPWQHAPDDDLHAITTWLQQRTDWLLRQDWTAEFSTNLHITLVEARALIQPNTTYRIELGPCPENVPVLLEGDAIRLDRCPGTVFALMRKAASREQLPSEVLCTEHGEDEDAPHAWGPMQWHALGRRMGRSDHGDAAEAFLRSLVSGVDSRRAT